MSRPDRRLRFRFQWRAVALLTLVWVLLWGDISLLTILGGAALAWLITVVFWLPPIHFYGRLHPGRVALLMVATLGELASASVQLATVAFRRRIEVRPGIVRVDLRSDNDLYQVAVAQLISIVPGSLVVDLTRHPRRLYLHVFDVADQAAVDQTRAKALAFERRLVLAVGSSREREAVR